jgi:hypothetical protein
MQREIFGSDRSDLEASYRTMTDAIKPSTVADRRPTGSMTVARCRSWLRELSTRFAWFLLARHGSRQSYCAAYRTSLAVLLRGLARDVALCHLCEPVHCYSHAVSMAWESNASLKRSPLLTR